MQCAHFGKLLLLLGANHVQIGHDFQPGYVFGQHKAAEPVELRTASFLCYARSKAHRTHLDKHHRARVTSHTPLALSARVQAAQCVSTQTFNRLLSPSSPSLRSSCPRCSESMGERHWAHAWAQAVVGVLQSSRHLGRHCRVQRQQPQIAANSVHRFHPHLDSTPSKRAEGYHNGIPGVAGGATEPTQTPRGHFSEVMVKTTFDLLTSSTKTPDEDSRCHHRCAGT